MFTRLFHIAQLRDNSILRFTRNVLHPIFIPIEPIFVFLETPYNADK